MQHGRWSKQNVANRLAESPRPIFHGKDGDKAQLYDNLLEQIPDDDWVCV